MPGDCCAAGGGVCCLAAAVVTRYGRWPSEIETISEQRTRSLTATGEVFTPRVARGLVIGIINLHSSGDMQMKLWSPRAHYGPDGKRSAYYPNPDRKEI